MTSAESTSFPSEVEGRATPVVPLRVSVSTLASGLISTGAVALVRAAILGPDADRPARLLLLLGGVGVPFSLMAAVTARSAGRRQPVDQQAFVFAVATAAAAVLVGVVGLGLLLGPASGADYRVALWQIETEPVVALLVALAAMALAIGARFGSRADGESVGSRRTIAVIGACVLAPMVRRLFGRVGDGGFSIGLTALLVLFDVIFLAVVAVVAYRGFGYGHSIPDHLRAARSGGEPPEDRLE